MLLNVDNATGETSQSSYYAIRSFTLGWTQVPLYSIVYIVYLGIRKKIVIERVVNQWKRLPREAVD